MLDQRETPVPVCLHCGRTDPDLKPQEPCSECGCIYEPPKTEASWEGRHPVLVLVLCLVGSVGLGTWEYLTDIDDAYDWFQFWRSVIIAIICAVALTGLIIARLAKRRRATSTNRTGR